jgi:hypothetical protein
VRTEPRYARIDVEEDRHAPNIVSVRVDIIAAKARTGALDRSCCLAQTGRVV